MPDDWKSMDNNSYWTQVGDFKDHIKNGNVGVVTYLGFRVADPDMVVSARARGFI